MCVCVLLWLYISLFGYAYISINMHQNCTGKL